MRGRREEGRDGGRERRRERAPGLINDVVSGC